MHDLACDQQHRNEKIIKNRVQDNYNEKDKININLMDNIGNNNTCELNLSFRKLIFILFLEHEGFNKIQSGAIDLITSYQNLIQVNIKDISIVTPGFDYISQKIKDKLCIEQYYWQTFVFLDILNRIDTVVKANTGSEKSLAY